MATYVYLPPCKGEPAQCQIKPNSGKKPRIIAWSEAQTLIQPGDILVKGGLIKQMNAEGTLQKIDVESAPVSLSPTRRQGYGGHRKKH